MKQVIFKVSGCMFRIDKVRPSIPSFIDSQWMNEILIRVRLPCIRTRHNDLPVGVSTRFSTTLHICTSYHYLIPPYPVTDPNIHHRPYNNIQVMQGSCLHLGSPIDPRAGPRRRPAVREHFNRVCHRPIFRPHRRSALACVVHQVLALAAGCGKRRGSSRVRTRCCNDDSASERTMRSEARALEHLSTLAPRVGKVGKVVKSSTSMSIRTYVPVLCTCAVVAQLARPCIVERAIAS